MHGEVTSNNCIIHVQKIHVSKTLAFIYMATYAVMLESSGGDELAVSAL